MKTLCLEIRDSMTCIPALAIQAASTKPIEDRYLFRCGYTRATLARPPIVILVKLSNVEANSDPYHWTCARTMCEAHKWIIEHWDELKDGDVVDVRVALGEAEKPAEAEIWKGEAA